eukprot:2669956-Amphidinium_carterae.1
MVLSDDACKVWMECYSTVIAACAASGQHGWVLEIYDQLYGSGLPVDDASYTFAQQAANQLGARA